jgi:hypothetical protein
MRKYNLAWWLAAEGSRPRYLLIPVGTDLWQGVRSFQQIWHDGEQDCMIAAVLSEVACLRLVTANGEDPAERFFLSELRERAKEAGNELPKIELTKETPPWG